MIEDADELVLEAFSSGTPSTTGWVRATCPFCVLVLGKIDKRKSFGILAGSGVYNCFRCGTSGKVRNLPDWFPQRPPDADTKPAEAMQPPESFETIASGPGATARSLAPAREYLAGRGITTEALRAAHVGACTSGYWQGRVIVPVLATDDVTWLGYVGRAWVKQAEVPYLYPRGMLRGSTLYNQRALFVETDEPVLIVEGVMDALHFPGRAVALLGKASAWHVETIAEARRPIAVVLDGDAHDEGDALAMRLVLRGARAGSVRLPPRQDPDEVCKSWLESEIVRCLA